MSTYPSTIQDGLTNLVGINDISPATATTRLVQMPRALYIDRMNPQHFMNNRPPPLQVVQGSSSGPPLAGADVAFMAPLVCFAPNVEQSTMVPPAGSQNVGYPEEYEPLSNVPLDLTKHFFPAVWIRSATKLHWTEAYTDITHYVSTTGWCNNVLSVNLVIAKYMKGETIIKDSGPSSTVVNVETIMPLCFQLTCIHMTGVSVTRLLTRMTRKTCSISEDRLLHYQATRLPRFAWVVFGLELKFSGYDIDTHEYLAFPHPVTGAPDGLDNVVPLEVRLSYNRMISNPSLSTPLEISREDFLGLVTEGNASSVTTSMPSVAVPEPLSSPPPRPVLQRENAVSFSPTEPEVIYLGSRRRSPRISDSSRRVIARRVGSSTRPLIVCDSDEHDSDATDAYDSDATEAYDYTSEDPTADSDYDPNEPH